MDCKQALEEAKGDFDRAIELLRKKGIANAAKKMGRIASEGLIYSYIHGEGRIGVLVEVNCETDFVARTENFQKFVKNIAMHIAASSPLYVSEEDAPPDLVNYDEVCLLRQPYIKDPDKKVSDLLKELISQIGENCSIRRFVRYQLGEGIDHVKTKSPPKSSSESPETKV